MNIIIKISDFINEIIKKVITIFLMIMTVVLFSQVVSRYIFSSGLSWSEELVRYLCVWLIFFGATCATKDGSQIAVTALEESLVGISRKILYYIQNIIVLIFSIFLLRIGMLTLETA
ncbi:MAG: TRAP transporter small permease subunit, partial [Tissierellales bacterium]|nr:TRAP transporter small permease subunit [Tissierellales bacterium]